MFKSSCRVCGAFKIQGKHWMPTFANSDCSNITALTYDQWRDGKWQECSPSDNLEYLEWKYEQKIK